MSVLFWEGKGVSGDQAILDNVRLQEAAYRQPAEQSIQQLGLSQTILETNFENPAK